MNKNTLNRLNLVRKVEVTPKLTARDWQLYDASMDCTEAVQKLNSTFATAVNSGLSALATMRVMGTLMETLSDYGAMDTEPQYVLEDLLQAVYG